MNKKDLKKILYNVFWMILDKILVMIMGFIVTLKVINHYQVFEYGIYQYVLSVIAIIEMGTFFVDSRVIKKMYSVYNADLIIFNATIVRVIITSLILIISLFYVILFNTNSLFIVTFIFMSLNLIICQLKFGISNYLEYNLKSKIITLISSLVLIVGYLFQLYIVYLGLSIVYICIVTCIMSFISFILLCLVYFIIQKKDKEFTFTIRYDFIKTVLIESFPLAIAAICAGIYSHCDVLMIGKLINMKEVAIYAFAVKIVNILLLPLNPIRESIYPQFIDLYNKKKDSFYKLYLKISSILTWFIIVGLVFSYFVLLVLFKYVNLSYANSFKVYMILSLNVIFIYNASFRSSYVTIINKGKILMISQIVSVFINIILNVLLIKNIGIYGAAISTVLTQCLSLFLLNIFFGKTGKEIFFIQLKAFNPYHILERI